MDIDAVHIQEENDQGSCDKQKVEGQCSLCNKQGHLKRNCLERDKTTDCSRNFQPLSHAWVTQLKSEAREREDKEGHSAVGNTDDDLKMKLHGMSVGERDDLIDALIGQKGF